MRSVPSSNDSGEGDEKRSRVFFGPVEDVFLAKIMRLTKILGTAPPYKTESAALNRQPHKSSAHGGLKIRMPAYTAQAY